MANFKRISIRLRTTFTIIEYIYIAAERAIETMNFDLINRRPIRIMSAERYPFRRKSDGRTISIKNLDKSIDKKALHDTFSVFGNIVSCEVYL